MLGEEGDQQDGGGRARIGGQTKRVNKNKVCVKCHKKPIALCAKNSEPKSHVK